MQRLRNARPTGSKEERRYPAESSVLLLPYRYSVHKGYIYIQELRAGHSCVLFAGFFQIISSFRSPLYFIFYFIFIFLLKFFFYIYTTQSFPLYDFFFIQELQVLYSDGVYICGHSIAEILSYRSSFHFKVDDPLGRGYMSSLSKDIPNERETEFGQNREKQRNLPNPFRYQ